QIVNANLAKPPPPQPLIPEITIINSTKLACAKAISTLNTTRSFARMTSAELNEIRQHFEDRKTAATNAATAAAKALESSRMASADLISRLAQGSYGLIKVDIKKNGDVKLDPSRKGKVMLKMARLVLEQIPGQDGRWRLMVTNGKSYPAISTLDPAKDETTLVMMEGQHLITLDGRTFIFYMGSDGIGTVGYAGIDTDGNKTS
ncbi:MAG: hypothetical protein ACRDAP_01495, partial [Shewanella sp.]